MQLTRYRNNPILSPKSSNNWESFAVCNPGAWHENGKVHLLYRASGHDKAHRIHFGLAVSGNGFDFRRVSDRPVISPSIDGQDGGCIEDPRIIKMDGLYLVTYAFRPFPPGQYWKKRNFAPEMPFHSHKNLAKIRPGKSDYVGTFDIERFARFSQGRGIDQSTERRPRCDSLSEKVAGRFVMLHRPSDWVGPKYGCRKPSIWISFSDDLLNWKEHHLRAAAL